MLTWSAGDEIHGLEPAVRAMMVVHPAPPSPAIPTISSPRAPSPGLPPGYAAAQRPTKNIRYSFSSIGSNAMVLVPPSYAQDTRPPYYITVSMNCFMPLAHITTIHRGSNEHGVIVAEFEMGIIDATSRVQVGNTLSSISTLLSKEGSREQGLWTWVLPRERGPFGLRRRLRWDYTQRPCICTTNINSRATVIAKFTPHIGPSISKSESVLEVAPAGHGFFDDILTSLLIVERKRLTPSKDSVLKSLFN